MVVRLRGGLCVYVCVCTGAGGRACVCARVVPGRGADIDAAERGAPHRPRATRTHASCYGVCCPPSSPLLPAVHEARARAGRVNEHALHIFCCRAVRAVVAFRLGGAARLGCWRDTLVRGWTADVRLTSVQMECQVAGIGDGELPGHYH